MHNKKQKFAIRKFNVGVGSVLIGSLVTLGVAQNLSAEEVVEETVEDQLEDIHIDTDENIEEIPEEIQVEETPEEIQVEEETEEVEIEQEVQSDADLYKVSTEKLYRIYNVKTTEEDILEAVSIPNYEGTYTVSINSKLPGSGMRGDHLIEIVVTFADGSTTTEQVELTVLELGPRAQNIEGTITTLTVDDALPNPEDYIANINEIREYYGQYGMEVTVEWGQAYHSKQNLIDNYFGEATAPNSKRILNRILVDGDALPLNYINLVIEDDVADTPDADQNEVETSHVYKMFRSATTEDDIVNAVSIPGYEGTYTVESTTRLPGSHSPRDYEVGALVTFEDGSTKQIIVPVTVLGMGPSPENIVGTIEELTVDDELPNPEDYISNIDEIRAYYDQYGMEVTVEWGQAYHSKQDLIDNYFGEATGPEGKRVLNRIIVDGERLFMNYTTLVIEDVDVPDAEEYEVEIDHVYKMFRSATTEEDIVNAVSIPNYEGTYTVESTSSLPGAMINREHQVEALVTFEDGSTKEIIVPVTVLDMGPRTQIVENPTAEVLEHGDEVPNPEDYIVNMDEIRAFYAQYDMEVTAEWGQAYHSKEDIIDKYFSEDTKFTLIRILVDGERLTLNTFQIDVQPEEVPDAEQYEIVTEKLYRIYTVATTEEDILEAVTVPNYDGDYTVEITSDLPGRNMRGDHLIDVVVTFADGSTTIEQVELTVLGMGPSAQIVDNPTAEVLNHGDELPNPEDYIVNIDEIRAYYAQYDMEVTAEWGQAYHSKEDIIDKYFSEDTKFTLIRILVGGERLTLNTFQIDVQPEEVPDAEQYEIEIDHVYKMFRSATTEEDIVNAVSIPNYEGTYTVESTSSLPGAMINREHQVEALVTFEDGSTKEIIVPVTVLDMGPRTQIVENPTAEVLNHGDELPNPEDYIVNMDEIRAFYAQYDMEVTAEWGQAYHSKEDIIDKYFSEDTKFTLIRILVDGERLTLNTFQIDIQPGEDDAEVYDVEVDHIYKGFESPKSPAVTEEDIVNAVTIPNYDGEYTVEVTSSLDGIRTPQNYEVEAVVIFEDGSTQNITVHVSVLPPGQAKKFFNGQ